jgi:hypothetical protein
MPMDAAHNPAPVFVTLERHLLNKYGKLMGSQRQRAFTASSSSVP